ncbi:MAG: transporter substrate-binding domain-containing protein [bacterium]|nr:transporter substrate-binding domain-containing protein [bacterium]
MTQRNQVLLIIVVLISVGIWFFLHRKTTLQPKESDTIIVGTNAEYPPFTFIENNTIVGFDIDVVKEVVKRLGKKIEIKDMPFDALIPAIQLGTIHVAAAGLTPRPEREKTIFYTKPYMDADPFIIISPTNVPINTLEELTGKKVVVNEGFTADYYISGIKGPIITRLFTVSEALLSMKSGRADAFVTARSSVQYFFAKQGKDAFHTAIIPNTEEIYALGVCKKYSELFSQIQTILEEMTTDGTLEIIKKKWNL